MLITILPINTFSMVIFSSIICIRCLEEIQYNISDLQIYLIIGSITNRLNYHRICIDFFFTIQWSFKNKSKFSLSNTWLTLSTLSNFDGLFYSLFYIDLKRSVGVKGLKHLTFASSKPSAVLLRSLKHKQHINNIHIWSDIQKFPEESGWYLLCKG